MTTSERTARLRMSGGNGNPHRFSSRGAVRIVLLALFLLADAASAETWRGLVVAPEHRCSPYQRSDYRYSQSVEPHIVASLGAVYGPYTGRCFASRRETDIEHIVALSEAHDSGLCAAAAGTRRRFASDLLNLTLADPDVNRNRKKHHDATQWMPPMNRCWFAARIIEVRRKYGLTVDAREANALERVLSTCASTEMILRSCDAGSSAAAPSASRSVRPSGTTDALRLWDDNGNGRITCSEARHHGIAPVPRAHPAYPFMHDGDGDGTVCE